MYQTVDLSTASTGLSTNSNSVTSTCSKASIVQSSTNILYSLTDHGIPVGTDPSSGTPRANSTAYMAIDGWVDQTTNVYIPFNINGTYINFPRDFNNIGPHILNWTGDFGPGQPDIASVIAVYQPVPTGYNQSQPILG